MESLRKKIAELKPVRKVSKALKSPYEKLLKQLFEELLGEDFKRILSGDFFSAYRKFQKTAGIDVQFCWVHLIHKILFVSEKQGKSASNYCKRLLYYVKAMFETIHQRTHLSKPYWWRLMKSHRRLFLKTVQRSVPEDKNCHNIAKRFVDFAREYFLFIDAGISPTNNWRNSRITQGSRSDWGNRGWSVFGVCCELPCPTDYADSAKITVNGYRKRISS